MTEEKRICASVTMTEELHEAVKAAAKAADQPLTVWCREAIKEQLKKREPDDPSLLRRGCTGHTASYDEQALS